MQIDDDEVTSKYPYISIPCCSCEATRRFYVSVVPTVPLLINLITRAHEISHTVSEIDTWKDPMDNPLMAEEDSKWSKHFEAQELIDEIKNDIERTYPEFEFFRMESTQKTLTQILHIWATMHPRISYKQGMNELLAPIVYVMSLEYFDVKAVAAGGEVGVIESLLDSRYLEHDAFCLFETIMESMQMLFDTDRPDMKTMSTAMRAQMNEMGGDRSANPSVWRCRQVHSLLEKVVTFHDCPSISTLTLILYLTLKGGCDSVQTHS